MSGALTTNFITLPVNGGLVTSRDVSDLQTGEMQLTDNAIYRPGSQALWPIGARERLFSSYDFRSPVWTIFPLHAERTDYWGQGNKWAVMVVRVKDSFKIVWYDPTLDVQVATLMSAAYDPEEASLLDWHRGQVTAPPVYYPTYLGDEYGTIIYSGEWFVGAGLSAPRSIYLTSSPALPGLYSVYSDAHGMIPTNESPFSALTTEYDPSYSFTIGRGHYFYWLTEYDSVRGIESMAQRSWRWGNTGSQEVRLKITLTRGNTPGTQSFYQQNPSTDYLRLYRAVSTDGTIYGSPFPANGERVYVDWSITGTTHAGSGYDIPIKFGGQIGTEDIVLIDTGQPGSLTKAYGVITLSVEGALSVASRDGTPPKWTFGDVFQDSLVINSVSFPTRIHYSYPGLPHSFPVTPDGRYLNYIEMTNGTSDWVTAIKSVDDRLIVVGTKENVYRLNYLPRASDAEFRRDKLKNVIASDHGIVGPNAITSFSLNGSSVRIAYVSQTGIYMTDGLTPTLLSVDMDWDNTVTRDRLPESFLVNYEDLKSLVFFHRDKAWFLSYDPQHIKNGGLKISGPCDLNVNCATYHSPGAELFTGGGDGYFYREDSPYHFGSGKVLVSQEGMHLKTGIVHPAGLHNEVTIKEARVLTDSGARADWANSVSSPPVLRMLKRDANQPDQPFEVGKEIATGQLWKGSLPTVAEGIGAEYRGFSPFHWVGFEYTKQRGR